MKESSSPPAPALYRRVTNVCIHVYVTVHIHVYIYTYRDGRIKRHSNHPAPTLRRQIALICMHVYVHIYTHMHTYIYIHICIHSVYANVQQQAQLNCYQCDAYG